MKNILLPTDFSENSWNAIVYALHFFEGFACNFYLLHVNIFDNFMDGDASYMLTHELLEQNYTKPAKVKLRQVLKRILVQFPSNKNHKFYALTDYNFFIDSIRKHVRDRNIEMIVMGTKGASGLQKMIIGSNTGNVITKVRCTILAVPENAKFSKLKEISFPTDFALNYNIKTLLPISEILEHYNSALRVLHVCKKGVSLNEDQKKNKELIADYFSDYKQSFHFLTNKKIEQAIQCFVESRDIDMITMVAKNLNYFQSVLFSPTVEHISYHTDVPLLVLHE